MSIIKNGGAAFPRPLVHVDLNQPGGTSMAQAGMSLRDYFAAAALQGLLASDYTKKIINERQLNKDQAAALIAEYSYIAADAMIAEREKVQP